VNGDRWAVSIAMPLQERTCVMVPIKTESMLHFSVHLGDGVPEMRLERVAVN
jgi:hypothetical protein